MSSVTTDVYRSKRGRLGAGWMARLAAIRLPEAQAK
jgi:hypothetical protein